MAAILPSGSFLGKLERKVDAEGFSFREVVDRSEEEIPRHTHEEAPSRPTGAPWPTSTAGTGFAVDDFTWSPDSRRIAFHASQAWGAGHLPNGLRQTRAVMEHSLEWFGQWIWGEAP